jgi:hypothetical protein
MHERKISVNGADLWMAEPGWVLLWCSARGARISNIRCFYAESVNCASRCSLYTEARTFD